MSTASTTRGKSPDIAEKVPAVDFIYSHGSYTMLDYPRAQSVEAHAISNSGLVAGDFIPRTKGGGLIKSVGFVYDGSKFTVVVHPNARDKMSAFTSLVSGVNSKGEMAVNSSEPDGNERSYIARLGQLFYSVGSLQGKRLLQSPQRVARATF
jgi:hypothetical protein